MADYIIINTTGTDFTDVNAADEDVAAGTISDPLTLDATELAAIAGTTGAVVLADDADTAVYTALYGVLATELSLDGTTSVRIAAPATGALTVDTLDGAGVLAAVDAGSAVVAASVSDMLRWKAAKLLQVGQGPGKRTVSGGS